MYKAIKVRLRPTGEQRKEMTDHFDAVRWVYNHALKWRTEAWKDGKSIKLKEIQANLVTLKKKETEPFFLKKANSQALQSSVIHLDGAFKRFFKKQGRYPKFKSRHGKQSMAYPQRVKVVGDSLYLPKVGNVKAILHREIVGKIKTVTVSLSPTGKFFASILCDDGIPEPEPVTVVNEDNVVGIDLGLRHIAIESNSKKNANPRFLKRAAANLRRKQKALSRKQKGSANRNKARVLVAKGHERTANARNDFQHKLSKRLIGENQAVCVETLKVKNMIKNRRLSKHISDASWSELVRKLEYKAVWSGKHLVKIDQWFASSKTCHKCKTKVEKMALSTRRWVCNNCGTEHDRDINAAINIRHQGIERMKDEGLAVSDCGDRVILAFCQSQPVKQEAKK